MKKHWIVIGSIILLGLLSHSLMYHVKYNELLDYESQRVKRDIQRLISSQTAEEQGCAFESIFRHVQKFESDSLVRFGTCNKEGTIEGIREIKLQDFSKAELYAFIETKGALRGHRSVFRILAPGVWNGIWSLGSDY